MLYMRDKRKCYCPDDCDCHRQDPPFNRTAICGCREHG